MRAALTSKKYTPGSESYNHGLLRHLTPGDPVHLECDVKGGLWRQRQQAALVIKHRHYFKTALTKQY